MSLDIPRSKYSRRYLSNTKDIIFTEIKSLVKQEKITLENENNHLKKNNEELYNRIQELYNEFDNTKLWNTSERFVDATEKLKHLQNKSETSHKKQTNLLKIQSVQLNNLSDFRNQLASSNECLANITIRPKENYSEFLAKDKEIEVLETNYSALKKKINEMESYNKDLQKECKTMAKSMQSIPSICENSTIHQNHLDIGLTVVLKDNDDSNPHSDNHEDKAVDNLRTSFSPTYIDIFEDKAMANIFTAKRSAPINKSLNKESPVNKRPENISFKSNKSDKHLGLSPIYADISIYQKNKFTSTDPIPENIFKSEDNKKHSMEINEIRCSDQSKEKIVKLSNDYEKLNNKLDAFNSNLKSSSITLDDTLLKKTSEDIIRISEEQQQIMNILQKNSKTLEDLQELKKVNDHFTTPSDNFIEMSKNMKNLSCQTDLILEDDEMTKVKSSVMIQNYDLIKLVNDQSNKIQDLSNKISAYQYQNTCFGNIVSSSQQQLLNFPAMEDHKIYELRRDTILQEPYETSLENISNLSDIIDSFSDKAVANVLEKDDESKSLSSIRLSTTESQDTLNDKKVEVLTSKEVLPEKSVNYPNQFPPVNPMKFTSKIPKLLTSKSIDLIGDKNSVNENKSYPNELESSYETLYDPVLSARYENDVTPM